MGKTVLLLSCTGTKQNVCHPIPAKDLYTGDWFKLPFEYAKAKLHYDAAYILSAKHHVVELDDRLDYYNWSLRDDMNADERREWAAETLRQLQEKGCDLENDEFIFLTGEKYYENLISKIKHHHEPLKGFNNGTLKSWYKKVM